LRAPARLAATLVCALGACRGQPSEKQPLHLIGDMDWQPKYQPEEASTLWGDQRGMRPLVEDTVARGELKEDDRTWRGMAKDDHGVEKFVERVPVAIDAAGLRRGEERFGVYCTPCHDRTGGGRGMVVQRGYPPPVQLYSDRVVKMPDGQIFWTMSNGVRNMPAYRKQIPVEDRWKIVAWVRVLQQSQAAAVADVPPEIRGKIEPEVPSK
jgi:mono/diheme cytochrome c family protein